MGEEGLSETIKEQLADLENKVQVFDYLGESWVTDTIKSASQREPLSFIKFVLVLYTAQLLLRRAMIEYAESEALRQRIQDSEEVDKEDLEKWIMALDVGLCKVVSTLGNMRTTEEDEEILRG